MIPEQLRYCPHCGSDEIKFVLKKSHRVRAVVAAVIAALSPHLRALSIGSMYAGSAALILRSRWRKEQLKNNQVFIPLTAFQSSPVFTSQSAFRKIQESRCVCYMGLDDTCQKVEERFFTHPDKQVGE